MSPLLPAGFEAVRADEDVNEKVQAGDLYWDTEDEEWLPVPRGAVGRYVRDYDDGVARKAPQSVNSTPKPTATVKRIRRTRRCTNMQT